MDWHWPEISARILSEHRAAAVPLPFPLFAWPSTLERLLLKLSLVNRFSLMTPLVMNLSMPKLRIQVATALLLTAITALVIGWYSNRPPSLESRILGRWRHDFPPSTFCIEVLELDSRGGFKRSMVGGVGDSSCSGTYETINQNQIRFTFEKDYPGSGGCRELTEKERMEAVCVMNCAFDSDGNLLLVNSDKDESSLEIGNCFIPSQRYQPANLSQNGE